MKRWLLRVDVYEAMLWVASAIGLTVLLVLLAVAFSGCGAQLSDSQHAALALETQNCLVREREIVLRSGTTEEQDRADTAAERARCDQARAAIVAPQDGGTP